MSMGAFSLGRVVIIRMCTTNMMKALTIAIRYSAVRKQFGIHSGNELPILEYQLQQWRLIPYLASMYAMDIISKSLLKHYIECANESVQGSDDKDISSAEMHAIICVVKPLISWLARDTIQECREACGGNGYLKIAGLGDLRESHDVNITYEGEGNVLVQQTSNYIINILKARNAVGKPIQSPFGVLYFLNNFEEIIRCTLKVTNPDDILSGKVLLDAYKWLICYLAKESAQKIEDRVRSGNNAFAARNNSQVFYLKALALAFGQHTIFQTFYYWSHQLPLSSESLVLRRLCLLFGLWNIEKHLPSFYEGGYTSDPNFSKFIREAVLKLCEELKNDAVSLVDVFAVPDVILNNPLGSSDGNVYNRLYNDLAHSHGTFSLPSWWREYEEFPKEIPASIAAKL